LHLRFGGSKNTAFFVFVEFSWNSIFGFETVIMGSLKRDTLLNRIGTKKKQTVFCEIYPLAEIDGQTDIIRRPNRCSLTLHVALPYKLP
jgi:hypothetical protein